MNLAGFDVDGLTLVLLSFGIASFVGTSFSSYVLKRSVKLALAGAPLLLALSALTLIVGKRQNRGGGNSDYLGAGVCAGAGGMVNVDHSFSCRSGGKSRFHRSR